MAKDKSQQKPPKRKKLPPIGDEVCVEQTKESKRKKLKVEVSGIIIGIFVGKEAFIVWLHE